MATFLDALHSQVGVPYRWAGDTPAGGFDCSGLVKWAAAQIGVELPHQASAMQAMATPIDQSQAGPGDLVFEGRPAGHVGVCLDAGCAHMLDAPHTGALVRIEPIWPNMTFGRISSLSTGIGGASPTGGAVTIGSSSDPGGPPSAADLINPPLFASKLAAWVMKQTLSTLFGGLSPAELAIRSLEVVVGGALLAAGLGVAGYIVAKGDAGNPARGAKRTATQTRTLGRRLGFPDPNTGRPRGRPTRPPPAPDEDEMLYRRTRDRERSEGTSTRRYRDAHGYRPIGTSWPGPTDHGTPGRRVPGTGSDEAF